MYDRYIGMIPGQPGSGIGFNDMPKFAEVYDDVDKFIEDYHDGKIPTTITDETATTLYYLLLGEYGGSTFAGYNLDQSLYKLFGLIFRYGPTWEKRLDIQKKLRELTDKELFAGTKAIYNSAANPSTDVDGEGTDIDEELDYIDNQNVTKYTRSKIEGYELQSSALNADVTGDILSKFKSLFKVVATPQRSVIYVTENSK